MRGTLITKMSVAALVLLGMAEHVQAVEPPDLYTTEVAFDAQRRNARDLAYQRALGEVLTRMTPEPSMALSLVDSPAAYVLGWRESGRGTLWVSFDGAALTAGLQAAGVPVWGSDRPLTLAWVGVEYPDGGREILSMSPQPVEADERPEARAQRAQLRELIRTSASSAGLPVALPVMDETDSAAVAVSDVWGAFGNVLRPASRRYRADSILIARVSLDASGNGRWRSQWLFSGESQTLAGDPTAMMRRIAANMLQRFAARPEESSAVRVSIVGVSDAQSYAELLRFLQTRSLVDNVRVTSMRQDELNVTLDALASRERLSELLAGEELEALVAPPPVVGVESQQPDLYFRWRLASDSF
ncbi:MAG: DUF2066 domain-containing protein [Pseudomonadota bacterium]